MFRSILVPLDTSALSEQALSVALSVARRSGATLHLAYVRDSDSCNAAEAQARAYLEAWAGRLRGAGCRAATVALLDGSDAEQDPAELPSPDRLIAAALHGHALATSADLVVMTTHSRGEAARLWLGSVADKLVRTVSLPILLVRPQQPPPDLDRDHVFSHVLIPLDGSPQAETVLGYAAGLSSLMGARCTLLQAIDPLLAGHTIPPYTLGLTKREAEQLRAAAWGHLARLAEPLRAQSLAVQTDLVVAEPAEGITAYAREHAVDLIAMATHGRDLVAQMFLGSTAAKVLHDAHVPVLLYRPPPVSRWPLNAASAQAGAHAIAGP